MPRKLKFQHRKKRARDARLSTKASCSSKDVHESKCDVSSQISSSTHTESPEVGSVSDTSSEMSSLTSSEFEVMEPETVLEQASPSNINIALKCDTNERYLNTPEKKVKMDCLKKKARTYRL